MNLPDGSFCEGGTCQEVFAATSLSLLFSPSCVHMHSLSSRPLSLFHSPPFSPMLSLCLCLSVFLLCLCLSRVSLCLFLCASLSVCMSLSLSHSLSFFYSISLWPSFFLALSGWVYPFESWPSHLCLWYYQQSRRQRFLWVCGRCDLCVICVSVVCVTCVSVVCVCDLCWFIIPYSVK